MTKSELIKKMAEAANISYPAAEKAMAAAQQAIIDSDKTTIKGFGTFEWRTRPARKGRNPATGAAIDIPESTTLHFKPSAALKNL